MLNRFKKKICPCQTPDGITLKKLQLDEEKKRVILLPLNQQYEAIILEEYELETFRILGEMALLFRVAKKTIKGALRMIIDGKKINILSTDKNIVDVAKRNIIALPAPCYLSN